MTKPTKIKVPFFIDDPGIAPCPTISSFPLGIFDDYIIIEDEKFFYKASKNSIFTNKSFDLNKIKGIVVHRKKVTCWKKDFSLDIWGRLGTDISLNLIDIDGEKHELMPRFFIPSTDIGRKAWNNFLAKLSNCLELTVQEQETS